MTNENVKVTQPLLDANGHLDIEVGDTVHPSQVTAAVTQEMLDADPDLVTRGVKVGDFLNASTGGRSITASVTGTVDAQGNLTATLSGDLTGTATGTVGSDGTFSVTFTGNVNTATA